MTKQILVAAIAAAFTGLTGATASAAVTGFSIANVILGFNATAGQGLTSALEVSIGSAASFRDTTSNIPNIISLGSILSSTYGANWFERTDLFFGLGTTTSNILPTNDPTLVNGDPGQTIYLSKSRLTGGNELLANSTITTPNNTTIGNSSGNLLNLQNSFVTNGTGTVIGGVGGVSVIPESTFNTFEDFAAGNIQFSFVQSGGVVQAFGTGTRTGFSSPGVEGALDLFRFQRANNLPGQYREGQPNLTPFYEGFFTIDNGGNLSFQVAPLAAIPEPSMLVAGLIPLVGMALRRRRSVVAA